MAARRFAAAGQARAYVGHDVAHNVALQSAGPLRIIGIDTDPIRRRTPMDTSIA